MTTQQFRRATVFALRMVPTSIGGARRWRAEVYRHVRALLSAMREGQGCAYQHVLSWENVEYSTDTDAAGRTYPLSAPACELVQEYLYDYGLMRVQSEEFRYTAVGRAVICCIRAALDVATEGGMGVLGWTVGDLRAMWRGRPLPAWVTGFFKGDLRQAPAEAAVGL